jgi:hypothetical protein
MKVLIVSRYFPSYHPRAGDPTLFVQKILHSLVAPDFEPIGSIGWPPKFHTIRAGKNWKVGDLASLRYWTAKPYASKQHEFAQVEIKKIYDIHIDINGVVDINNCYEWGLGSLDQSYEILAKNDGLSYEDFCGWFPSGKEFTGQIICWTDLIKY